MAVVLFWVALGALAMGALNWLFPAWPNEKRGMRDTTDPVCRMQVDPTAARAKTEYEGQTYYFCCRGCKVAFEENPEHYVGQHARPQHQHAQ